MPENDLVITLSLKDEITAGLQQAAEKVNDFSNDIKKLGKEMSQTGQKLAFFGAAIVGPFSLAMKESAKYNEEVAKTLRQVESSAQKLNDSIAKSLIPIFQTLNGALITASNMWFSLSQSTRDFIVQSTFLSGVILLIGGGLGVVIGKLISLGAAFASVISSFLGWASINPVILLTVGLVSALLGLMIKFQGVANTILSTFEVLFRFLVNGIHTIYAAIGGVIEFALSKILAITDALSKIPGPTQDAFRRISDSIRETASVAHEFASIELNNIADNTKKIGDIFQTGSGQWSDAFQSGKESVQDFINSLNNLQNIGKKSADIVAVSWTERWNVMKGVVGNFGTALQQMAAQNKKFAVAAQAVSIGIAIMNAAESITNIWAKWGAYPPVAAALTAISAAATGLQIATIANQSFAVGTPNVPSDMTAQVHKGETIIPATFAESIRRGELSLSGGGGVGGGDIQINLYGVTINSKDSVRELAEDLGFEIDRKLRNARSRV